MVQLVIICVSCAAALFLIVFGAVTDNAGILSAGTGIIGALLGAIGVKYEVQISDSIDRALCKIGLHKWEKQGNDGIWKFRECKRCFLRKQDRII
jgi:hypothetical protein